MKPLTLSFLSAEFADSGITAAGLALGFHEVNPVWQGWQLWAAKAVAVAAIALLFERKNFPWWYWSIPVIAGMAVIWNLVVIIGHYCSAC